MFTRPTCKVSSPSDSSSSSSSPSSSSSESMVAVKVSEANNKRDSDLKDRLSADEKKIAALTSEMKKLQDRELDMMNRLDVAEKEREIRETKVQNNLVWWIIGVILVIVLIVIGYSSVSTMRHNKRNGINFPSSKKSSFYD